MTNDEIKELKQQWIKDPVLDIEKMAGPKHRKDLLIFRLTYEKKVLQERVDRLEKYRDMLREFLGIDELENKLEGL